VTDKLGSYGAAHRAVMASVVHDTTRYANNRAEVSHQPARQRERQMRRFKSPGRAQRRVTTSQRAAAGREAVPQTGRFAKTTASDGQWHDLRAPQRMVPGH
jgi:transposase-like protein